MLESKNVFVTSLGTPAGYAELPGLHGIICHNDASLAYGITANSNCMTEEALCPVRASHVSVYIYFGRDIT